MRTLYWIIDVDPAEPGGIEGRVRVATAGSYSGGEWIVVRDGDPLLAALGRDPDGLDAGLAGLRIVAEQPGSDRRAATDPLVAERWVVWDWGTWDGAPEIRPLILADRTGRRPWGLRALEGPRGERLASMVGLGDVGDLLRSFETFDAAQEPAVAAAMVRGRHVVVAGQGALAAIGGGADVGHLGERLGARSIAFLAHPAGRTQGPTPPIIRLSAAQILAGALLRARALPTTEDTRLAREWERGAVDLGSWSTLREAGIAASGAAWDAAWGEMPRHLGARMGRLAHASERLWQVWPGGRLLAIGECPTEPGLSSASRRPWIGVLGSPAEACEKVGRFVDAEDAALAVEQAARRRGWLSPWEARNRALAADVLQIARAS